MNFIYDYSFKWYILSEKELESKYYALTQGVFESWNTVRIISSYPIFKTVHRGSEENVKDQKTRRCRDQKLHFNGQKDMFLYLHTGEDVMLLLGYIGHQPISDKKQVAIPFV